MNSSEMVTDYVIANGPKGLLETLDSHYERCQKEPEFAKNAHYILYQFGSQKSLIKVDMSERPYQFWYYDLLGRPITATVKETIAQFLTDTVGEEGLFEEIEEKVEEDKNAEKS